MTSLYKQINNIDEKKEIIVAVDGTFNNINCNPCEIRKLSS